MEDSEKKTILTMGTLIPLSGIVTLIPVIFFAAKADSRIGVLEEKVAKLESLRAKVETVDRNVYAIGVEMGLKSKMKESKNE